MMGTELIVGSWNEWDPLEEIVVGIAEGACFEPSEPACRPVVRRNPGRPFPTGPKPESTIAAAAEELDGLADLLARRGITVRRPTPIRFDQPVRTPTFNIANMYCASCPRDVMITIGHEIIEAPMSRRARYFEYLAYRDLVSAYWRADPAMTWTVAPKPTMADRMYDEEFWDRPLAERHRRMHESSFCLRQEEIAFDAADITRMGNDIFVQESMTTNRAGIAWLTRHLAHRGVRVHAVHFPLDRFPSHIDCTFVPLRPGLVLTNPERPIASADREIFDRNGWQFVDAPLPITGDDDMPDHCQSSMWLSMNVLSLSPTVVVCEAREAPLHHLLDRLGFEVLTVPFRHVYEFGGSLHCATWDIRRTGGRSDFFAPAS